MEQYSISELHKNCSYLFDRESLYLFLLKFIDILKKIVNVMKIEKLLIMNLVIISY